MVAASVHRVLVSVAAVVVIALAIATAYKSHSNDAKCNAAVESLATDSVAAAAAAAPSLRAAAATPGLRIARAEAQSLLAGEYVAADGSSGIRFEATQRRVVLSALDGTELVSFAHDDQDVQRFSVMNRFAAVMDAPRKRTLYARASALPQLGSIVLEDKAPGLVSRERMELEMIGMLGRPEMRLVSDMAHAVAALGYNGKDTPFLMNFLVLARRLTTMVDMATGSSDARAANPLLEAAGVADKLGCTAYPNQNNDCFGMCGLGCTCWSFVCGDCCYHQGCADHDNYCRTRGMSSACCLAIGGFSCSGYNCWW